MPFFSETPNTVKTRSGFHDPPESARGTPSISKSICRENLLQSSTVRNFNEREDFRDAANTGLAVRSFELPEDPSFWKEHNVQVFLFASCCFCVIWLMWKDLKKLSVEDYVFPEN